MIRLIVDYPDYSREFLMIPMDWIFGLLAAIAAGCFFLGLLSAFVPSASIHFYERIMRFCRWKVEPLNPEREITSTRVLGCIMLVLSILIAASLQAW